MALKKLRYCLGLGRSATLLGNSARILSTKCDQPKDLKTQLFKNLKPAAASPGRKVTICGTGAVGMACAIALLSKNISNNIVLMDINNKWAQAETLDLMHSSVFLNNPNIQACSDGTKTKDSRVVVVTAGVRPKAGETRLDVANKTADILKEAMPKLVQQSPKAIFMIVSNPADVMTWVAQKAGNIPIERCFSSGCHLDTARFRHFIAQRLQVAASAVQGFVIGEHGGSSVPCWSSVNVGGVLLKDLLPTIGMDDNDPECWRLVHEDVVKAAFEVIKVKGYTNWAVGLTVANIVASIYEGNGRILSLSTNVKGMHGINDDIFLSLPCIVRAGGISAIVQQQLSDWEKKKLQESADILLEAQCTIKL